MTKKRPTTIIPPGPTNPEEKEELGLNVDELFKKLKEFENRVVLDKLKGIERTLAILFKQGLVSRKAIEDLQEQMSYVMTGVEDIQDAMTEPMIVAEGDDADDSPASSNSADKKQWN